MKKLSAKVLLKEQAKTRYNSVNQDANRVGGTASRIDDYASASNKMKQAKIDGVQEVPSSNLGAPTIPVEIASRLRRSQ